MAKSARSLRYASAADMPAGMARLHQQQEGRRAPSLAAVLVADADAAVDAPPAPAKPTRKSKYGAIPTWVDGIRFDSKREAKYYEALKLRVAAGEVAFFTRQTPVHLPDGTKLVLDFVEYSEIPGTDGYRVRWVDVKGRETPVFRLKKRAVEHHYPHIRIELA